MNHLELVVARQAEPNFFPDARKRTAAITDRLKKSDANAIALMIQEPLPRGLKVIMLKKLTDELNKATNGIVPCKAGCSHCCHMATTITLEEAEALSKASGKPLTTPAYDGARNVERFTDTACPFLVEDHCSVYDSRPFSCRTYFSVDRDDLLCKLTPGVRTKNVILDAKPFNQIAIASYEDPRTVKFADIREFFPKG